MSADNGVYILRSKKGKTFEYRVKMLQAIEDLEWDHKYKKYSEDAQVHINNARKFWKGCKVYKTEQEALKEAYKLHDEIMKDDLGMCEYGIRTITILKEF